MRSSWLVSALAIACNGEMVQNWKASLEDHPINPETHYRAVFEWDHVHKDAVLVDYVNGGTKVYNAADDERCSGDSKKVSPKDNAPFWMPRFNSRQVSAEITRLTGIRWASIDWQPCGHKDITICHAESHYDVHFYYVDEKKVNSLPMCEIGSKNNPALPVCRDSATNKANSDYFRLINDAIPTKMDFFHRNNKQWVSKDLDFCVDPSSAILRSGVHYGDRSETLKEWRTPVTIIGSHDCKLQFFEPMVSWKWISGSARDPYYSWPKFHVNNIEYKEKNYKPLPDGWSFEVSEGCKAWNVFSKDTNGHCHIKLVVEGEKCVSGVGETCPEPTRKCGNIKDCITQRPYENMMPAEPEPTPVPTDMPVAPVPEPTSPPVVAPTSPPTDPPTKPPTDEEPKEPAPKGNSCGTATYLKLRARKKFGGRKFNGGLQIKDSCACKELCAKGNGTHFIYIVKRKRCNCLEGVSTSKYKSWDSKKHLSGEI